VTNTTSKIQYDDVVCYTSCKALDVFVNVTFIRH